MKDFIFLILNKVYTLAAIVLGLIILIKRANLIKLNIPFIDTIEVIALIACLFAIFDIFHVISDKEIKAHWKIYGIISNIFVLLVVFVIGGELLNIEFLQKIADIKFFYHAVGILLILDNIIWFLIGE